jgi:pimeloyl-ACP methyl ester carboxylesterase
MKKRLTPALLVLLSAGCANFAKLGENLNFMEETIVVTGRIENAEEYPSVRAFIADWDREKGTIQSVDYTEVKGLGLFGFFVKKSENLYMWAWSDSNGNDRFDQGEPAWISHDETGEPKPVIPDPNGLDATGSLKPNYPAPQGLIKSARDYYNGRDRSEVKSGWEIPLNLGEVAKVSEERFSSEGAAAGYWEPASYPMKTGLGIYFTEKYDPNRAPVLFVHGAAGSPHDFEDFFKKFDRKQFQLWFYHYPSGRRLAGMGGSLDKGLRLLQSTYGFKKVHVVAHSMGGLVARRAILENQDARTPCIGRFVSISSPFGGQENAAMGVKRAPSVIPSWRDIEPGSEFLGEIFKDRLRGDIDYMLLYGNKSSKAWGLPAENDGTLSVASMTYEPAVKDAVKVRDFPDDHMSILSNPEVIKDVENFLKAGN